METRLLFREDAYQQSAQAHLSEVTEQGHIILDQTPFYPTGGGQPGDEGTITLSDGSIVTIATTQWEDKSHQRIVHIPAATETALDLSAHIGTNVSLQIHWQKRYRYMRIHTALHLLSVILPYPVTGGSVGDGEGRLDFDIPEATLDKQALSEQLQALVDQDQPISERWITDAELEANPQLVKTMSVQPPKGAGHVRLIQVESLDLQPCGGTHLKSTEEIGKIHIRKIEKKGKQNRRVRIQLLS